MKKRIYSLLAVLALFTSMNAFAELYCSCPADEDVHAESIHKTRSGFLETICAAVFRVVHGKHGGFCRDKHWKCVDGCPGLDEIEDKGRHLGDTTYTPKDDDKSESSETDSDSSSDDSSSDE